MKIKNQLSLIFSVMTIILMALASIIIYYNVKKNLLQGIFAQLESISQTKVIRINRMIKDKYELANLMANNILIENLNKYLKQQQKGDLHKIVDELKKSTEFIPSFKRTHILTLNGKIIASSDSTYLGKDFSTTESFVIGKIKNQYLDGFFEESDTLYAYLSSQIKFQDELIGILLFQINASDIISLTNDYTGLGKTGETSLATRYGDKTVFLTPLRFDKNAAMKRTIPSNDLSFAMNRALLNRETIHEDAKDYMGQSVICSTRYIEGPNWGMVTKINTSEAYIPINRLKFGLIIINLVAFLIIVIIARVIGNYYSKLINKLIYSVIQIKHGNLSTRIDIASSNGNEIITLTGEFNQMVEKIEDEVKKITQTSEMLTHSNESLKKFAYVVAHDLKSPLHTIDSLATILKNEYGYELDQEGYKILDMLIAKVALMEELIRGILSSTQSPSDKTKSEIDLKNLIMRVIENFTFIGKIQVLIPTDLPKIYYPKIPCMQIFQNLIGNSFKFIDKEDGKITISYIDKGKYYEFCVRDNGPGIRKEDQENIFKMFEKKTVEGKSESTGIGLSIVKRIVQENGGDIWVESEIGKGAAFYFTIPKER